MLDRRNLVRIWLLFFAVLGLLMPAGVAQAATYDATGRWMVVFTPTPPATAPSNLCLPVPPERFVATLAQSGETFTVTELGGAQAAGTISGETYAYQITRSNGSASAVSVTLNSDQGGTGTVSSSWSDGQGGTCTATGDVMVTRANDAIFDASGSWNVQVSADQLDATLSNPACLAAPAKTLQAAIVQTGSTFMLSFNDAPHLTGEIDGGMHTLASIQTGSQIHHAYTHFLLFNADSGYGSMHWVSQADGQVCAGSNTVMLTRAGVVSDPQATLSVSPMNLTVGQSRLLNLHHVVGTPAVGVSPETGVVALNPVGGVTRVQCEAPGQATVTVTDANGSAAALITCVAAPEPGSLTEYPLADWIYPAGVTRVTQELWQSAHVTEWAHDSFRWSRSGASLSFLDRGTLSTLAGDEGMIYTLDDKGLIFHGEKDFDRQQDGVRQQAFYGFVNPPVLDPGAVEILPEQVELSNLTPPSPMLPASVVDGHTATTTRIEYPLDAAGQPVVGQWTVVKQEIMVAGPVDLLAEHPPEGLHDDSRFLQWRDAITDAGVLNRLTGVIRLHVVETRFRAGSTPPETESGDLFLANGLGIVFERWNQGEGRSVSALVALDKGDGLVSVTGQTMVARQFRIEAPTGTTLEHAFVQTRVEHNQGAFAASPHVHESMSAYNETPQGNTALLTIYDRAMDMDSDSTRLVHLVYGAKGYERQVAVDVDLSTLSSPAVLPLTSDHLGRAVTFSAKDGSGAIIAHTGLRVAPVRDGSCAWPLAQYQELSPEGLAILTLAGGQRCVEIWPKNPGDFIGGWYDATIPSGQVNIVAPQSGALGLPFTFADAVTEVKLVAGRDVAPDHHRVSGTLTNGLQGLAHAEILAYPVGGGEPYLFHTDSAGAFTLDLPAGAYVFVFRHTGSGFVAQGYLTATGETNQLSATQGVGQHLFSDLLLGEVKLTSEFQLTTATFSGVVTDSTTARISGPVTVRVRSANPTGFFAQTTTGSAGEFALQLPLHEEFRIEFVGRGNSMLYRGFVDAFGNVVADAATQSAVAIHGNMTLNVAMIDAMGVQTYPIVGKVTENNATTVIPVPGATVRAVSQSDPARVFEAVTDAMGYYNLSVEAGSYRIEFFARGYVGGLASGEGTSVTLGGAGAAQNYLLGGSGPASLNLMVALAKESGSGGGDPDLPKVTITGQVNGGQGGLAHILVEFQPDWEHNTGHVEQVEVKTDAQGHYSAAVYPGQYRVMFRAVYWDNLSGQMVQVPGVLGDGGFSDGNGQVTEAQEEIHLFTFATDDQVNAQLPSGARISGTVTNASGQPVQGVKVEFQPDYSQGTPQQAQWVEAFTDAAGQYVAFVQPGAVYRVYFSTNYWDWQTQKPVKLPGLGGYSTDSAENTLSGESSEAKIHTFTGDAEVHGRLATGLTIQGVVTASDGETALADVLVRLQPEWDEESGSSGTWAETHTDSAGRYTFTSVPGKYRIEFLTSYWKWDTQEQKILPGNLVGGFADGQGGVASDWSSAKVFRIGAATEVNTRLLSGMVLSGSVAMGDGTLAKGALVYVHTRDWTTAFHGKVDEQGNFSINVKPGLEYRVQVWPAYCESGNTDTAAGCGEGFVSFLGGHWVTPPDASWVTGWVSEDASSRPVVVASGVTTNDSIPGAVLDQSDDHVVTNLRMDQSLTITILVDGGVQVQGRVVDADNNGIAHAWVSSDFGDGPTDQYGYFTLNLPSASVATQARATFGLNVQPGGYEDPETHVWVPSGDFMGGMVACDAAGVCRLTPDASQAAAFGSDLASGVAWPFTNLGNGVTGLLVQASRGVTISGTVDTGSGGLGDVWVNAWSAASGIGSGAATGSGGEYAIRVATPAEGATVWYEVNLWKEGYLAPEARLVKVQSQGVVGVYAIDKNNVVDETTGMYRPQAGELILGDDRGGVPVNFTLTTGNTISGRVTDASNNGLAWTWVDIHSQDGSRWYGANT
ncbi:MAG: carboxypeptidase regulatory-like domain-containing protein, partial [Magnetococcales bacterium]|nr:carboxypeptidase regulatory-like domain-containing protein [Magnetococcales bacterium]